MRCRVHPGKSVSKGEAEGLRNRLEEVLEEEHVVVRPVGSSENMRGSFSVPKSYPMEPGETPGFSDPCTFMYIHWSQMLNVLGGFTCLNQNEG